MMLNYKYQLLRYLSVSRWAVSWYPFHHPSKIGMWQPICADWFRGLSFIHVFLLHILYCQAKISLLKKACKDKDAAINDLSEEIRELRHSIATSALDDLSKIRSYGYSPENFLKLSSQREQQLQKAKRDPEVCVLIMDNQSVCKIKLDAVVC